MTELRKDTEKEWEELGIETDWVTRARIRGWIMPACPWLDAAERMIAVVGRPAAELTKLFANQLDYYTLSPEEEAHKEFERIVESETYEERLKHQLAMSAYTGSPVSPINKEVYKWASWVIDTVKYYHDQTYKMMQEAASMPRLQKVTEWKEYGGFYPSFRYRYYEFYIPRYNLYISLKETQKRLSWNIWLSHSFTIASIYQKK